MFATCVTISHGLTFQADRRNAKNKVKLVTLSVRLKNTNNIHCYKQTVDLRTLSSQNFYVRSCAPTQRLRMFQIQFVEQGLLNNFYTKTHNSFGRGQFCSYDVIDVLWVSQVR